MNEKRISLDGKWKLYYALEDGDTTDDIGYLHTVGKCIDATVPGNVELDLYAAGIEPDPFYGENIYKFRKYEFYRWQFERSFVAPEDNGSRWNLCFDGLNCIADIFLNGRKIGDCANAMIPHAFDITDYMEYGKENNITVLIHSALNHVRKMDIPVLVHTHETGDFQMLRMPASSFGWDIVGRFISAGMWRSVSIVEVKPDRIVDAYYVTRKIESDGTAVMRLRYRWDTQAAILDGFTLELDGLCGNHVFHAEKYAGFVDGTFEFTVPDARLWWPHGYGEASLYDVTLTLKHDGNIVDVRKDRIGIRKLEIDHIMEPNEDGEFKVIANGCPIMCKGSNWVPLDVLHSRDRDRLGPAMELVIDSGCNILRCWGGNVYEDHDFFNACDEHGILVWQDFSMACCIYSEESSFLKQIEDEASAIVRKLRNHPSILLWAGDNEIDYYMVQQDYDASMRNYNVISREVLPHVVRLHDPYRFYLPSSPYIKEGMNVFNVPEQHNWGPRGYFKDDYYKLTTAHFISECGYHGCPSVESLRKFIPEKDLDHWLDNPVWTTHDTDYLPYGERSYNRIRLMHDQVEILFGNVPADIETFSFLSQISQAEAMKFLIERTRGKKWRRTGIIWWNILDGWPQISDAVVDYYFDKKLAYYYIKRVQKPVAVIMDELYGWERKVYLCNDSRESCLVSYKIEDADTSEVVLESTRLSPANENIEIGRIREIPTARKLYLITWEINGKQFGNHYITGYPAYDADTMLGWVKKIAALPEPFDFR